MPHKKTILVVEDERALQGVIQSKLTNRNFDVLSATSVEEALKILKKHPHVSLIWLDHYLLGSKNGLDFVMQLKDGASKWKNIPVYIVTNTAGRDAKKKYMQLGVDQFFVKSDNRLDEIVSSIEDCL